MDEIEARALLKEAEKGREYSYSPYSHFAVGAVIKTKDGTLYYGANIENASYPLCMCAERNAIYNAYNHGVKKEDILSLALIADAKDPCSPCGACRQVIGELLPAKTPIIMGNIKGDMKIAAPEELLPFAFTLEE